MINFLRSKPATLAVLTLALIAQIPHAAEVFRQAGNVHDALATVHSFTYALALELAVLLFVVQGRRDASYAFAFVSVLVNLAYYAQRVQLLSVHGASAWLISIALPVAIALYSHAVADAHDGDTVQWRAWLHSAQRLLHIVHEDTVHEDTVHEDTVQPTVHEDTVQPTVQPEPRDRAAQLHSEGLSNSEIAEMLGVHRNTVGGWLRTTNGKVTAA